MVVSIVIGVPWGTPKSSISNDGSFPSKPFLGIPFAASEVFVELRTARPVMTCEGAEFPRLSAAGGLNLRQTGRGAGHPMDLGVAMARYPFIAG